MTYECETMAAQRGVNPILTSYKLGLNFEALAWLEQESS